MASVELVGRLLVSLAVVLGLMWLIARRLRAGKGIGGLGGVGGGRNAKVVEVLDRTSLSRSASVAVVRVNGQAFVLGVAEHGVSVLGETDLSEVMAARAATPSAPRRSRRAAPSRAAAFSPAVSSPPAQPLFGPVSGRTRGEGAAHATQPGAGQTPGALAGSALSPQTWRQTVESLRDLTSRG